MSEAKHYFDESVGQPDGELGRWHEFTTGQEDRRDVNVVIERDGLESVFEAQRNGVVSCCLG